MKRLTAVLLLMLFSLGAQAQSVVPYDGDYYTIEPDYRYCPSPYCGGWWLTKVNQYSIAADASLLDGAVIPIVPNPIYVVSIDYKALGLSEREIAEFQSRIYEGKAFIRGILRPYPSSGSYASRLQILAATGTWVAANDKAPYGPYMRVKSSGIVCITTPCPYYKAEILNSNFQTLVDELNLKHAELTDKQTELAWREVSGAGLIMTGVRYESQGQTGPGLGIAATKVFFTFPGPLDPQ